MIIHFMIKRDLFILPITIKWMSVKRGVRVGVYLF